MTLSRFRVWTTPNLYAPFTFTEVDKCNVRNIRWENKGLGACQIDIDLRKYDDLTKTVFESGLLFNQETSNISTGYYIFIQDVARLDEEDRSNSEYTLGNPWDTSVIWWGYISARNFEVQAKSNDVKGSLDCLQIGHAINKFKIRMPKEIRNGFNPEIDGRIVGNKKPGSNTFLSNPNEFGTNPMAEVDKYWTVRQVVDYTVLYGCPFAVSTDWSLLEDSMAVDEPNRWLEQYEQIPSYENEDLTSALEDILDTLGWDYYWDSQDEEIKIRFFDPIGNMSDEYIDTYNIPKFAKQFSITSEEQSYEKVVLRGNRVLVAGSVSTYGKWDSLKMTPSWTNSETDTYINPYGTSYNIHTVADQVNSQQENEAIDNDDGLTDEAKAKAKLETPGVEAVLNKNKAARQKLPNVYQHFKWGMGDTVTPTISGNCLYTNSYVGNWLQEKDMVSDTVAKERAIPFFPRVSFQDPNTTKEVEVQTGEFDEVSGLPITETVQVPKNIDELVYSTPVISDEKALHQTPIASEMVFEDTIPWKPYEKENEWYNKPRFYYRTFGKAEDFGGTIVYDESWQYGDLTGDGLMSSEFALDWQGIKLTSPEPESFASPSSYIFQQGATAPGEYDTTVEKFGVRTDEWKSENAISKYDPYREKYNHKGHWSRMIFSFAARSNQRIELSYGNLTSTDKTKFEEDETLEFWIIRKGFVPYLSYTDGIGGGKTVVPNLPLPKWEQDDTVARNDIDKAKQRLKTLWNFWSKPKRAVQIILPAFDAQGNIYDPGTTIGSFLDSVTDSITNNTAWEVNSYVSSIEMNLDSMSPSITIATEYPASPRRTREKRLMSANKFIRFGKAPSNKGVR